MTEKRESTVDRLAAMSRLAALGHSEDRLRELQPKVAELFATGARLRQIDVDGYEMAVNYETWPPGQEKQL